MTMSVYRYSRWDGSKGLLGLGEDELLRELERRLMSQGDLSQVLWKMQREGIDDEEGRRLAGNRELFQRLHQMRRNQPGGSGLLDKMDRLEAQLTDSQRNHSLESIDRELVRELLGDEAAEELELVRSAPLLLEKGGYISREAGSVKLTPRGTRKIGQKALEDIFDKLRKDRAGGHNLRSGGIGIERMDETRKYEFGDAFELDLKKTIMNSLLRQPQNLPLNLSIDDFEVFRMTQLVRTATVLMLDLSFSMSRRGSFQAAKQVAIALDELIRSKYPKDSLHIVGVSSYACEVKRKDLPYIEWDEYEPYTNIQHGLSLAGHLLSRDRCAHRQIIMISDGEPTAHLEGGDVFFQYPTSRRTLQLTMREVEDLTRKGILINAFILHSEDCPDTFVRQMAQVNKGRVFFTAPDSLGEYLVLDYVGGKRSRLQ